MAKGKSQCFAWVCTETNAQNYVFHANPQSEGFVKKAMKFCKALRKRTEHVKKVVKKGSNNK